MKWTKFREDFGDGYPLMRFLKDNSLSAPMEMNDHAWEPSIVVPNSPNKTIESCFRIYEGNSKDFEAKFLDKEYSNRRYSEYYHSWHYLEGLPEEYFDTKYSEKKGFYPIPHPYEIYIGGWIQFFDEEVRGGDTDHAVYFKWDKPKKAVNVYILQTRPLKGINVHVNVNITKSPTSTDPPPPKTGQPPC
jgi:hypothetical protein